MGNVITSDLYPGMWQIVSRQFSAAAVTNGNVTDLPILFPWQIPTRGLKRRLFIDQVDVIYFNTAGTEKGANCTLRLAKMTLSGGVIPASNTASGSAGAVTNLDSAVTTMSDAFTNYQVASIVPANIPLLETNGMYSGDGLQCILLRFSNPSANSTTMGFHVQALIRSEPL